MHNVDSLPIVEFLPAIQQSLRECPNLVLVAEPGAGKTTMVPAALLQDPVLGSKGIYVVQPRRLAARLVARYVAEQLGERLGERVGYQVRFDEQVSAQTQLRFVTEGILQRLLANDPTLQNIGTIIFDEFHERSLASDVCLALVRQLQQTRRADLRLIVMSATLDENHAAAYLGGCPIVRVPGRLYPVQVEHLKTLDERALDVQVDTQVRGLLRSGLDGDVLVFLPGMAEIRRCERRLSDLAASAKVLIAPLHGSLPQAVQEVAVRPNAQRKIILSTNVAETSVTIDGVTAVVDSGLANIAGFDPWSQLSTLRIRKIAQAAAVQRAGRAGRTKPGVCLRLYTQYDFAQRPPFELPEVARLDLSETLLLLAACGVRDFEQFGWYQAPATPALLAAQKLLHHLSALQNGTLTDIGAAMQRFPVHPRLARIIVDACKRGVGDLGCLAVALLSERDVRLGRSQRDQSSVSDVFEMLDYYHTNRGRDDVANVSKSFQQLRRIAERYKTKQAESHDRTLLAQALLMGYGDRVGKRVVMAREKRVDARLGDELLMAEGGRVYLSQESVVKEGDYLIALNAEEQTIAGKSVALVTMASSIEADWLLEAGDDFVSESADIYWNASAQRVDAKSRLNYGAIVLDESRLLHPDAERVSDVLFQAAQKQGLAAFITPAAMETLQGLRVRASLLREHMPELGLQPVHDDAMRDMLRAGCEGRSSFRELSEVDWPALLVSYIGKEAGKDAAGLLARHTPPRLRLQGGREVPVHYETGKPPWIESRLQDFFGMNQGPVVLSGRVSVVLHLLAPNQRAVQVTSDLAGFWQKHYPALKPALSRRYPRHQWPDDPRALLKQK